MNPSLNERLATPAFVVAMVALFVALGGIGYAAATLPKNSVGSKQIRKNAVSSTKIKNRSVTGSDLRNNTVTGSQINEATLGTVPKATSADSAVAYDRMIPFAVTVAGGQSATLATHGPLSIVGRCQTDAANLEGNVLIATTEDGTAFGGDDENNGSIGPGTPEANRLIEDPGATSAGPPSHSDGYDDDFNAIAPSGASIAGTVGTTVSKDGNYCKWNGFLVKTS